MRTDKVTGQKYKISSLKKRSRGRRWLLTIILVSTIALVGVIYLLTLYNKRSSETPTITSTSQQKKQDAALEDLKQAIYENSSTETSGNDRVKKLISDAKKNAANDNAYLTEIYMLEAANYYNNGVYNKALISAKDALNIAPNSRKSSIYQFLAYTYEKLGDKESAIDYVGKAIDAVDKSALDYEIRLEELNDMKASLV